MTSKLNLTLAIAAAVLTLSSNLVEAAECKAVTNLSCTVAGDAVTLEWTPADAEMVILYRNGEEIAVLDGAAASASDAELADGEYSYSLVAVCADADAEPATCQAEVGAEAAIFLRGDANGDGTKNIADVITTLNMLFGDAAVSQCPDAVDSNDDGSVNIGDAAHLLFQLFGDPATPQDQPECSTDKTDDDLPCESQAACP